MATREEQEYSSQAPAGYIGDFLQQVFSLMHNNF